MAFGESDEQARWDTLPRVEVTQEQLSERLAEWLEQAKLHANEPVLAFSRLEPDSRPLQLGVVRSDIDRVTDPTAVLDSFLGIALSEASTATSDGYNTRTSQHPIHMGLAEVNGSFQRVKTDFGDRVGVPRFQIVFGNEAISEWFTQQDGERQVAAPFCYVQMMHRLGFEPILTPEIAGSVAVHREHVISELVHLAVKQFSLSVQIDTVYGSIGSGAQSTHGGLAIGMAPEDIGEANLRTYQPRQERARNQRDIQRLLQVLTELGVDEAEYYRAVGTLLGVSLPSGEQAET